MKTLPEILRDALLVLDDEAHAHELDTFVVVIERGDPPPLTPHNAAYQIRLRHEKHGLDMSVHLCETRSWLGRQWSSWHERRGWLGNAAFDLDDVLATDWRILS